MQRFPLVAALLVLLTVLSVSATAKATDPKSHRAPEPKSASDRVVPAAGCCNDARVSISIRTARPCFTENGVRAFMTLFQAAAEKGVENATIRAFNGTNAKADCQDCEKEKK